MFKPLLLFISVLLSPMAMATEASSQIHNLTHHWVGYTALIIFVVAYGLVIFEEQLHLAKSKPVLLAAGIIWLVIALFYHSMGDNEAVEKAMSANFLDYAELFFFLLVAMTYINVMLERGVFNALRDWLVNRGFGYRTLFWLTGVLAFFISAIADNLTTALILCTVIITVGKDNPRFITLGCINLVVAANAGGAFSPFGDITTLMVWQSGMLSFTTFFKLFIPSVVNFAIPALIIQFALPKGSPLQGDGKKSRIKPGGKRMVILFLLTIATAVSFENFLHIPPVFGMMTGLGYLKVFSYYLGKKARIQINQSAIRVKEVKEGEFDVFKNIANAEWDTLLFFYGVILAVGGLGFLGYLGMVSGYIYGELGPTSANILVGVLSAVIDNIPVMFAVLTMHPDMNQAQWLLVTLTAGVGGSLLSIGSAAGVALMGQAKKHYRFFDHLKWTPVIALGYAGSIWVHFLINGQ